MARMRLINILIIAALILGLGYQRVLAKRDDGKFYIGKAGWYGQDGFRNMLLPRRNADGTLFNDKASTCAMRSRHFGHYYKVTNLKNGKSVIVKHVDFGPAKKYHGKKLNRLIDLSRSSFARIADLRTGVIKVKVERVLCEKTSRY